METKAAGLELGIRFVLLHGFFVDISFPSADGTVSLSSTCRDVKGRNTYLVPTIDVDTYQL